MYIHGSMFEAVPKGVIVGSEEVLLHFRFTDHTIPMEGEKTEYQ